MSQAIAHGSYGPGTRVEVRSRFDSLWKRGFEIDTVIADGYLVRRLSDGTTLPACFDQDDLRVERDLPTWR